MPNSDELSVVLEPTAQAGFVETDYVKGMVERAHAYTKAGFPVHFRGPSGTGKTTLALHLAHKIGRPVILIHGDAEFTTADLIGGEHGHRFQKVVDNFIHTVHKYEENMVKRWVDNRLTIACKHGFTLVYDEFSRSRPEANNVLLSILQEKIMDMPAGRGKDPYLKVHSDFTAIFTSNPEEYAGVNRTQDALRDRMITMDVDHFDYETEVRIARSKSGLSRKDTERVVKIVRGLRESEKSEFEPTVRASIMIARTLKQLALKPDSNKALFEEICQDILSSATSRVGSKTNQKRVRKMVADLIDEGLASKVREKEEICNGTF
ncbi:gas vesicle protein GvpN [Prosthecochloris sp. SCSIO W1101]|uniref:gas vesicle protein GvpN n=1 Tax=Prosthecochloris sp. SCSIO W1101 TaxID=2992242 RepID=UPI00223D640E|nr:gas vesicle protein GvpN [Prosthecochloris sp. SCSIO W1101]UZJ41185.1 gas vesicle protein GvpN [Prosthecochloris sp. SCSIO W1101]